jgi:filamentous hemagglutinin
MCWPPQVGKVLPRAKEVFGLTYKLTTYSLASSHGVGGDKARGFEKILGITLEHADHLEAEIRQAVLTRPIIAVRQVSSFGTGCAVDCPVRGVGHLSHRVVTVRTSWIIPNRGAAPRLTSAYLKP